MKTGYLQCMLVQAQPEFDLFGIPLPSDDRWFVAVVVIHILFSFVAVLTGLVAMLKEKNSRGHARFGMIYYWAMICAFATVVVLAAMQWPHNNHLFVIGVLATIFVLSGRWIAKRKSHQWARLHTICMGLSYILLLTGFYVDNGKHLPFWNQFPAWFFYIFPALIGLPTITRVLNKHPLTKKS